MLWKLLTILFMVSISERPRGMLPKPIYRVIELSIPQGDLVNPRAINNKGQVVGYCTGPDGRIRAFHYSNRQARMLGTLVGCVDMYPTSINDRGEIVGYATGASPPDLPRGFLVRQGRLLPLASLMGQPFSRPAVINNKGQIAGSLAVETRGSEYPAMSVAFLWQNGKLIRLPTWGGWSSTAYGMNSSGQVVGTADVPLDNRVSRACLWSAGRLVRLETPGRSNSNALAMNDRGWIVGEVVLPDGSGMACLWRKRKVTRLGRLPGCRHSTAHAINVKGEIVGESFADDPLASKPFLYRRGRLHDLNTLIDPHSGWRLVTATAINDCGAIVGMGRVKNRIAGYILLPGRVVEH